MLSVGWWVHFIVPQLHLRVLLIQLWFWNRQCQNSGGRWTCSFLCVPQTGPLLGSTKMTLPDTLVTYQQASSFLGTSSLNSVSLRKQVSWRQPWAGPPLENTVALVTKQPLVTDTSRQPWPTPDATRAPLAFGCDDLLLLGLAAVKRARVKNGSTAAFLFPSFYLDECLSL